MPISSIHSKIETLSLLSTISSYASRSYKWLKEHPLIPVAIVGIVAAGYIASRYSTSAPVTLMDKCEDSFMMRDLAARVLAQTCRQCAVGYQGLKESDFSSEQPSLRMGGFGRDLRCYLGLKPEAFERIAKNFREPVFCPESMIPFSVMPFLEGQCSGPGADCSRQGVRFDIFFHS